MRPTKRATLDIKSNLEIYSTDFQPQNAEESIASLREENEMLRRMAANLEQQTQIMRAACEKPKPRR